MTINKIKKNKLLRKIFFLVLILKKILFALKYLNIIFRLIFIFRIKIIQRISLYKLTYKKIKINVYLKYLRYGFKINVKLS